MGNLPLPASTGAAVLSLGFAPPGSESAEAPSSQTSLDVALLDVLREAATTGSRSAEAILNALADAARVLSGADGTAIASRSKGVIVCRARSGGMAPGLGAPVNSDSGISGECLRTASIQICNDALTDSRVDAEVCRALEIRSIAVIPLRGRVGIFGILEAFSARMDAFKEEQIDTLRSLAGIAEIAYERERSTAGPNSPIRAALFPVVVRADRDPNATRRSPKFYWILACVLVSLFAMVWIARISWRQTGAEIAASTATTKVPPSTASSTVVSGKPGAAVLVYPTDRTRTRVPDNASVTDSASETAVVLTPSKQPSTGDASLRTGAAASGDTSENAPPVEAAVRGLHANMPEFASETAALPKFGGPVSHGVIPATAVKRVSPIYPLLAESHGIAGDVILEATISQTGSVRKVAVISGPVSLTSAAVAAVRHWQFSPAMLDGKPVEVQQRITMTFKLP